MKTLILLLLISVSGYSQDTTAPITDSSKGFRYPNAYIVITEINMRPPGLRRTSINANTDSTNWVTDMIVKVYASKADYKDGKAELFTKSAQTLYTANLPTKGELLLRMRKTIQ